MLPKTQTTATIVVCEDDEITRELLADNLRADRFRVLAAPDAATALEHCRDRAPELLLLDLNLPDCAGLDVLREIRGGGSFEPAAEAAHPYDRGMPVIVLSGRGSDADRVRGLVEGADDYLVKPFHYPELLARIRNVLDRRTRGFGGPRRIGDILIDPLSRTVAVGDRGVELANKEFELLRLLAGDPTKVFTKKQILHDIWGYELSARTRTLDSHASRLRRKLDPDGGRYVINCWGVGYRLVEGPA